MPTKKRPAKPAEAKPTLTRVAMTYIEAQLYKTSIKEIAADLSLPVKQVREYADQLRTLDGKKTTQPPTEGLGKAATREKLYAKDENNRWKGATVMTAAESMQGDIDAGVSPFACVHITESQKAYIQSHMKDLTEEQLAKDTGLRPVDVRQVVESLNPQRTGREKFMKRHRNSIHKIRPNEPIS